MGLAWFVCCRSVGWHLLGFLSCPSMEHGLQNNLPQQTLSKVHLCHLYVDVSMDSVDKNLSINLMFL